MMTGPVRGCLLVKRQRRRQADGRLDRHLGPRLVHLAWKVVLAGVLVWCPFGCASVRVTDPKRTATEQFLLAEAATLAVEKLSFEALRGRRIFVDTSHFASLDKEFVIGQLRAKMLIDGVAIAESRDQAEIVVEIRSRAVGIDRYGFLVGIPSFPIPTFTGVSAGSAVLTPEIAPIKSTRQYGYASIAYVAFWRDSGQVVISSGPFVGRTMREDWWILGFGPRTVGNIPTARKQVDQ